MWYDDIELKSLSTECDRANDSKNSELLLELSEKCRELGEDQSKPIMVRAHYYYNSFTSLSNYLGIEFKRVEAMEKEKTIEKSLFLCRSSLNLMNQYFMENELSTIEKSYFKGLYYPAKVNYCNLLVSIGRYPNAIYSIKELARERFGMAIGNLGLEVFDYARLEYDNAHQQLLFEKACSLFKEALKYPDSQVHPSTKDVYRRAILSLIGENDFEEILKSLPSPEFLERNNSKIELIDEEVVKEEFEYREWAINNALMLNTVNDVDYDYNFSHDSIHLPSMLISIDKYNATLHGLFNQIKQEYCSARYMLYEGISQSDPHFSDREVFLINTLDYPKYGLNVERAKSAYRVAYSLFDRIAYFLDKYYELGYKPREVSFKKVWTHNSELLKHAESNLPLKALHWIKKDLYNSPISDYDEYIDPILHKTNTVRNIMEHRYLKILDSAFVGEIKKSDYDHLADVITTEEFYDLGINLIRTCREAIILLCMAVNIEERKKDEELGSSKIPPMSLPPYEDDWKF